jgi:hypothetical protein
LAVAVSIRLLGGTSMAALNAMVHERGPLVYLSMYLAFMVMTAAVLLALRSAAAGKFGTALIAASVLPLVVGLAAMGLGLSQAEAGLQEFLGDRALQDLPPSERDAVVAVVQEGRRTSRDPAFVGFVLTWATLLVTAGAKLSNLEQISP